MNSLCIASQDTASYVLLSQPQIYCEVSSDMLAVFIFSLGFSSIIQYNACLRNLAVPALDDGMQSYRYDVVVFRQIGKGFPQLQCNYNGMELPVYTHVYTTDKDKALLLYFAMLATT